MGNILYEYFIVYLIFEYSNNICKVQRSIPVINLLSENKKYIVHEHN